MQPAGPVALVNRSGPPPQRAAPDLRPHDWFCWITGGFTAAGVALSCLAGD